MTQGIRSLVKWIIFGNSRSGEEEFQVDLEKHDEIIDRMKVAYERIREPDPVTLRVRGRKHRPVAPSVGEKR